MIHAMQYNINVRLTVSNQVNTPYSSTIQTRPCSALSISTEDDFYWVIKLSGNKLLRQVTNNYAI